MPNDSAQSCWGSRVLWLLLAAPLAAMTYGYLTGHLVYGEYLHLTGEWSTRLLIVAMALTPLRRMFPKARIVRWLLRQRRYFGVAAFAYAFAHLVAYLVRIGVLERILNESVEPGMLAGWVALLIFVPLALTSNNYSASRLGRRWKLLHRFIYLAAVLTILHWMLVAFEPLAAYVHGGVLLLLELYRVAMKFADQHRSKSVDEHQ